jgi:hypothetical protein
MNYAKGGRIGAVLAVVVGLALIGGGVYWYLNGSANNSQSTGSLTAIEEMRGWATHEGAGLQFNYPAEWKLNLVDEGVRMTVYTTDIENPDPTAPFGGVFSVTYVPNQGGLTLEEWWEQPGNTGRYIKTGETTIAGYPAYRALVNASDDPEHIIFVTHPKDAMSYIVDITIVAKHSEEVLASFKAM